VSLEAKTVLVTGASSGLGQACAGLLAERGARVIAVGRNAEALRQAFPDPHLALQCDVGEEESVTALVQELKRGPGPIHGWVMAAGVQEIRPLITESRRTLENLWKTNVFGTLGVLAAALKARLVARGGSIVLFSSVAATAGGPGLVSYAATKGAIEGATHSLALELASQRIRVNAIAPGVVRTPMADKYLSRMTKEQAAAVEAAHPLGFGTPESVAEPVLFLLSDASQWITGSVLLVDGGLSSH